MNRAQRGVMFNLLGSFGCLAVGVDGMLVGRGGGELVLSPAWGLVFIGSTVLLGLGTYLQLTPDRGRSNFLAFPRPGDLRGRKIRLPTDVS